MIDFDPAAHGFVQLEAFEFPGGIAAYEYRNHAAVDGRADMLRLNIYLSRDGSYVTIWAGLIEPAIAEAAFELDQLRDLSFADVYCETLFRGHIDNADVAGVILTALRLRDEAHAMPQILAGAPHDLRCEPLPAM